MPPAPSRALTQASALLNAREVFAVVDLSHTYIPEVDEPAVGGPDTDNRHPDPKPHLRAEELPGDVLVQNGQDAVHTQPAVPPLSATVTAQAKTGAAVRSVPTRHRPMSKAEMLHDTNCWTITSVTPEQSTSARSCCEIYGRASRRC